MSPDKFTNIHVQTNYEEPLKLPERCRPHGARACQYVQVYGLLPGVGSFILKLLPDAENHDFSLLVPILHCKGFNLIYVHTCFPPAKNQLKHHEAHHHRDDQH